MSSRARPELRPYVRAYAQRVFEKDDPVVVQSVPLNSSKFSMLSLALCPGLITEIGMTCFTPPGSEERNPHSVVTWNCAPGLRHSLFLPARWMVAALHNVPVVEVTNRIMVATAIPGAGFRSLWNRVGEGIYSKRVQIVEEFLLRRVARATEHNKMTCAANYIFRHCGALKISSLANHYSLGVRQFRTSLRTRERHLSESLRAHRPIPGRSRCQAGLAVSNLARHRPQRRLPRPDAHDPRLRKARPCRANSASGAGPSGFALCVCSKVQRWCGPQSLLEHGNKRARRTVASFQGRVGDLLSLRQKLHCPHETKLLPPLTEGKACIFQKESLHSPFAGTSQFAELLERPGLRWIGQERLGDSKGSWVARVRKL